jgi:hypothetical protein
MGTHSAQINRLPVDNKNEQHDGRGRPPHKDLLTPAEWKVVHSVKFHVANALAKLGLANRKALRHYTFGKLAFFDCGGMRLMLTEESKAASSESKWMAFFKDPEGRTPAIMSQVAGNPS